MWLNNQVLKFSEERPAAFLGGRAFVLTPFFKTNPPAHYANIFSNAQTTTTANNSSTKTEKIEPLTTPKKDPITSVPTTNYTIFPNPNKGAFELKNIGATQKEAAVEVLDMAGKRLFTQVVNQFEAGTTQKFELKNLSAGQYLLRIQNTDKTIETLQMVVTP